MTRPRWLALILAVATSSACGKKREAKPDDVPTATSPPEGSSGSSGSNVGAAPSASASALATSGGSYVCREGIFLFGTPGLDPGTQGFGGLSPSASASEEGAAGAGAGSDGVDLGSVGVPPHTGAAFGAPSHATTLRGVGKITAGAIDLEKTERALCNTFDALHVCFSAFDATKTTLSGTDTLSLVIAPDARVDSIAHSGTLADEALETCVSSAIRAATLPLPASGAPATLQYTLDYARRPGPPDVRVKETAITVTGVFPAEVVRRIVRRDFAHFRYCYEPELKKDPTLGTTLRIDFTIDDKGVVTSAKAGAGTLTTGTAPACIAAAIRALVFPVPEKGAVTVHYDLAFSAW